MARPHDRRCPHHGSPRFERSPVLSSSYRNRLARQMPQEEEAPPPPPPPDLIVSGTLTPDSTGDYFEAGTHNGKPYYKRDDDAWFIWWRPWGLPLRSVWLISIGLDDTTGPFWGNTVDPPDPPSGNYDPYNGAVGTATVAEP